MAYSSCFCHSQFPLEDGKFSASLKSSSTNLLGWRIARTGADIRKWNFLRGSRISIQPKLGRSFVFQKCFGVRASWMETSQIARSIFTFGTAGVLPFYALMVLAPKSQMTRESMESSIPHVVLGLLYAFLLFLSCTPDKLRLLFPGKYWLPELPGIAKMFSRETTLASAWIHVLAVDLSAARQVFYDGLENAIETRRSVSLCLLCCPIGIVTHYVTKALTRRLEMVNVAYKLFFYENQLNILSELM